MVAALDTGLPLALLPVRLATRFHRPNGPGTHPTELWLRIFPDLLHADGHFPKLTKEEVVIGRTYWERLWRAGGNASARTDAHQWIVNVLDAPRAAWVAKQTAPTNPEDAPAKPVPATLELEPAPTFPVVTIREDARATVPRLLPDRWFVSVSQNNEWRDEMWSKPVKHDIAMAPNLGNIPDDGDVRALLRDQHLWWMVDFDTAVDAGMAMRVPLNVGTRELITDLIVFGVRDDDSTSAEALGQLLDAHRFTSGLEFVPQGTPTNNTDTVKAGFSETPEDLEGFFTRHLEEPDGAAKSIILTPQAPLSTKPAADAATTALGLSEPNAFDHAEHADDRTAERMQAMNQALWPATLGYFLTQLLSAGGTLPMGAMDLGWMREWFRDWVRGGAFLPVLQVGTQPYGVLPIARRPEWNDGSGSTTAEALESLLVDLDEWENSVMHVPTYATPDTTAPPTPEEEAVRVASVLGAVPHPMAFRLREANDRYDDTEAEWSDGLVELENLLAATPSNFQDDQYHNHSRKNEINNGSVEEQSSGLAALRNVVKDAIDSHSWAPEHVAAVEAVRDYVDEVLWPMAQAHKLRSEARSLGGNFSNAHLPTAGDPPLWYVEYGDDGAADDGTFPQLKLVPDADADLASVAATLRDLAADARSVTDTSHPSYDHSRPRPLLRKLIEQGIESVHVNHKEDFASGIERLADLVDGDEVADPMAELERLMRETLGLAMHRHDAWVSSIAAERLANLRQKRPQGLQVGAYGWLVNLTPDDGGPDTKGFIHAPSLDHAATAAVLRSSWLAFANNATDAAFSVNLSSDRVRRGQWILEGVHNGVDLGELLGMRFERRLHDAGLSHLIADIRELVRGHAGDDKPPHNAIVDGLAIAVAYADSTAKTDPLRTSLDALRQTLPGYPSDQLLPQLRGAVADLDATADLLTAQSVHSVTKGNLAEAAASLTAAGSGEGGVPKLRMPNVHRESRLIGHRVVAVFNAPSAPVTTLLGIAEPALAGWCDSLFPGLNGVSVIADVSGQAPVVTTIGDSGLTAIEVVGLSAVSGDLSASQLAATFTARARFQRGLSSDSSVTIEDGSGKNGTMTMADVAVAAGALRTAIGSARPLRSNDLIVSGDDEPKLDIAELNGRRLALAAALSTLSQQPADDALLIDRFSDLAALDPSALTAALETTDDRSERIDRLLNRASRAAGLLGKDLPDDFAERDPQAQADYLCDRIAKVFGVGVPILPRFRPTSELDLLASLDVSNQRMGSSMNAMAWLMQVGRVHADAGKCAGALDLIEALDPTARVGFQVAQLPHVENEPWLANSLPTGDGSRLCILSVTDAQTALRQGNVSGLLFDAWSEPIPGQHATTGVAVHFDRPGAQAPQAVLLAMPPREGAWSVEEIATTLEQTLHLAQARAVGPETLHYIGHTLPAVFVPDDVEVAVVDADDEEAA